MKQLLFLFLFPCLAMAQYQGNGNQKITLGEQTTSDGLVFRGVASIDTVTATSKITRANKQDTSAYLLLDTVTNLLWHYKIGSNAWTQAGGGVSVSSFSAGSTGLTPSLATTGAVTLGGTLAVANGGTGASVKIFVDTFSTQTVNGLKTYGNIATFNDSIKVQGIKIGRGNVNSEDNLSIGVRALTKNTTSGGGSSGLYNIAIGRDVLRENTTGNQNTAIGMNTLRDNTTGSLNVALGLLALRFNTTGNNNLAIGTAALDGNTTGGENIGIGRDAMRLGTIGNGNVAIGTTALYKTTGDYNTGIGNNAGWANSAIDNTTGSNNTFIGNGAVGESATESNRTWIGNTSTVSTWVGGNLLVGTRTNGTARLQVKGSTNALEFALKVDDNSNNNLLSVQNNGNVTLKNPLSVANGGTGQNTLALNKVMVGNGTSGVLTPTNLHWDNTNSRLGIGVTNPISAIHTNGVFTAGSTNVGYVNLKGFLWGTTGFESDWRWQSDAVSNANNDLIFQSRGYYTPTNPGGYVFNLNYSTGDMRIYSLSGTGLRPLSAAADGTLTVSSSITIKENVSNLNYGLDKIMQLQPKSFNYIDKNKYGEGLDIGFIAEDVYSIVPEATGIMNDGFIYFDAVRLIPILTKAIQEQNALIKALEQRIINLENK